MTQFTLILYFLREKVAQEYAYALTGLFHPLFLLLLLLLSRYLQKNIYKYHFLLKVSKTINFYGFQRKRARFWFLIFEKNWKSKKISTFIKYLNMKIVIFLKKFKNLRYYNESRDFLIGFEFSDDFKRSPKKHSKF